jgi:ubiquinone/menaquinone biosynthesis C-methylase UbiE
MVHQADGDRSNSVLKCNAPVSTRENPFRSHPIMESVSVGQSFTCSSQTPEISTRVEARQGSKKSSRSDEIKYSSCRTFVPSKSTYHTMSMSGATTTQNDTLPKTATHLFPRMIQAVPSDSQNTDILSVLLSNGGEKGNDSDIVRGRCSGPATSGLRRAKSDPSLHVKPKLGYIPHLAEVKRLLALPNVSKKVAYDEAQGGIFGRRIMNMVNDASACILISIGNQLGLFAAMSKLNDHPQTARTIATAANNAHVRYVEEWLRAMTCIGIVEESRDWINDQSTRQQVFTPSLNIYPGSIGSAAVTGNSYPLVAKRQSQFQRKLTPCDNTTSEKRYILPAEHAIFLTWDPGAENLALVTQYISVLGRLEKDIVKCFKTGSGMDWTRYLQFDRITELDTVQTIGCIDRIERELFALVPELGNEIRRGIHVLCLGSSMGRVYISIAHAFPKSWFTLYDTSSSRLAHARQVATDARELPMNLHFAVTTAGRSVLEEERTYDAALVLDGSVVRDSASPYEVLRGVCRALRPTRSLVYLDMCTGDEIANCPGAALQSTLSAMQAIPLGLNAGGPALGRLWGAKAAEDALQKAGFAQVTLHRRENDDMNCVLVGTTAANPAVIPQSQGEGHTVLR